MIPPGRRALLGVVIALTLAGCRSRAGTSDAAAGPAGGEVTLWTDSTELFMEYPALVVRAPGRFAIHLTDLTDFAPLRSGRITLRFQPREGGAPLVVTQDAPRAPGIFGASPDFARPGVYDLTLLVESPQARDSITVPGLTVYPSAREAPREGAEEAAGISFLKEQQWKTPGFATAFAGEGSVIAAFEASGVIGAAAGREADVSAPVGGLVDPTSVARSPVPGQRVARGRLLAALLPSLDPGGGSPYADARARLREAEDEHDRARRLVDAEAAPRRRLHEAQIRLQAAREALAGLGAGDNGRIEIRAPIGGVVISRTITPGARVEGGAPLFRIVDPSVVWLTVNVPAARASQVSASSGASFTLEGSERRYTATRAVSVGSVIDPASRTLPVIYEVRNPDGSIKIGANARAEVRTGRRVSGVVIPASALLDEDGRPIVYVQPSGESFEKRELRLGGRDGDRVLVLEGLRPGERVVTGAAYQVRLASLSAGVPAQGHEH